MTAYEHHTRHRGVRRPGPGGQRHDQESLTVIYLTGAGRTGSTLIERLLETYDNVGSVGELEMLWFYVTRLNLPLSEIPCPCGLSLAECPRWHAILAAADFSAEDLEELVRLQRSICRTHAFFLYFVPFVGRGVRRRMERLAALTGRLYRAAAAVEGAEIIVDASLIPTGALVAKHIKGVELHVKHVVRRPEAVAFSWFSPKYHPGFDTYTAKWHPLKTVVDWLSINLQVEAVRLVTSVSRYRYEWFVRSPRANLEELMSDVPQFRNAVSKAFLSENEAFLESRHAILGNPDRFRSGKIAIRADERYLTGLPFRYRALAVAVTLPLYLIYGYRWWVHGPTSAE